MSQRFNLVEGRRSVASYFEPAPGLGFSESEESEEEDMWQHRWVSSGVHEVKPRKSTGESRVLQADFEYVSAKRQQEDKVILRGGRKGRRDEEMQKKRRRQGLLAVGFLGFIKNWENSIVEEYDLAEEKDKLDCDPKDSDEIRAAQAQIQLHEHDLLVKEQQMLRTQLKFLQEQALIQQEAQFLQAQQSMQERVAAEQEKKRAELQTLNRVKDAFMSTEEEIEMLKARNLMEGKTGRKEAKEEDSKPKAQTNRLLGTPATTKNIKSFMAMTDEERKKSIEKKINSATSGSNKTSEELWAKAITSVQNDVGVKATIQQLVELRWYESVDQSPIEFRFVKRNNHVLGQWKNGKLSCFVTDGGKNVQGAWSMNNEIGEFVLTRGRDSLCFRGFFLKDGIVRSFYSWNQPPANADMRPILTEDKLASLLMVLEMAVKSGIGSRNEELSRGDKLRYQDLFLCLQSNPDLANSLQLPTISLQNQSRMVHKSSPLILLDLIQLYSTPWLKDKMFEAEKNDNKKDKIRHPMPSEGVQSVVSTIGFNSKFATRTIEFDSSRKFAYPTSSAAAGSSQNENRFFNKQLEEEALTLEKQAEEMRKEAKKQIEMMEEQSRLLRRAAQAEAEAYDARMIAVEAQRETARLEQLLAATTGKQVERFDASGRAVATSSDAFGVSRTYGGDSGNVEFPYKRISTRTGEIQ